MNPSFFYPRISYDGSVSISYLQEEGYETLTWVSNSIKCFVIAILIWKVSRVASNPISQTTPIPSNGLGFWFAFDGLKRYTIVEFYQGWLCYPSWMPKWETLWPSLLWYAHPMLQFQPALTRELLGWLWGTRVLPWWLPAMGFAVGVLLKLKGCQNPNDIA